eukprot:TRINITY_DN1022_c0_g1_i2.p1 TRINITY_DN1022_c0_g1~~TRINITY_DN1022_c0_g1_i2.p1  ORF type:complete len:592 (-),score=123.76 TRINITY_DN1022_c0_g1_i2:878-2653(-)
MRPTSAMPTVIHVEPAPTSTSPDPYLRYKLAGRSSPDPYSEAERPAMRPTSAMPTVIHVEPAPASLAEDTPPGTVIRPSTSTDDLLPRIPDRKTVLLALPHRSDSCESLLPTKAGSTEIVEKTRRIAKSVSFSAVHPAPGDGKLELGSIATQAAPTPFVLPLWQPSVPEVLFNVLVPILPPLLISLGLSSLPLSAPSGQLDGPASVFLFAFNPIVVVMTAACVLVLFRKLFAELPLSLWRECVPMVVYILGNTACLFVMPTMWLLPVSSGPMPIWFTGHVIMYRICFTDKTYELAKRRMRHFVIASMAGPCLYAVAIFYLWAYVALTPVFGIAGQPAANVIFAIMKNAIKRLQMKMYYYMFGPSFVGVAMFYADLMQVLFINMAFLMTQSPTVIYLSIAADVASKGLMLFSCTDTYWQLRMWVLGSVRISWISRTLRFVLFAYSEYTIDGRRWIIAMDLLVGAVVANLFGTLSMTVLVFAIRSGPNERFYPFSDHSLFLASGHTDQIQLSMIFAWTSRGFSAVLGIIVLLLIRRWYGLDNVVGRLLSTFHEHRLFLLTVTLQVFCFPFMLMLYHLQIYSVFFRPFYVITPS